MPFRGPLGYCVVTSTSDSTTMLGITALLPRARLRMRPNRREQTHAPRLAMPISTRARNLPTRLTAAF